MEGEKTAYPPPAYVAPADQYPAANPAQQTYLYPTADAYYSQEQPQQPQTNVVVVKQQPTPVVSRQTYSDPSIGSGPLIFSIFVTVFAVCCCWWALLCSIPAIIFAVNASSAGANGDLEGAKSNRNISLGLSAATLLVGIAGLAIILGVVFGYYWPIAFRNSIRFG